jgi:CoA:oxalate CoA-transferase
VVDLGLLLPGPFATRLLADLGADVIKVEPPHGDPGVDLLPGLAHFLERGKRSLRVDLKTRAGVGLVLDLIATADVVLEGFRPGVADRLGIGFAAASSARPGLVYCSISGYGQDGPDRDRPAHDVNAQASGGAVAGVLALGLEASTPHLPFGDLSASLMAALSITAALLARTPGSESVHLDVSMQEAVAYCSVPRWGRYLREGMPPQLGDLVAYAPGAGVFTTRDGRQLALAAMETPFWRRLCATLCLDHLGDPPFDTHEGRMRSATSLREEIVAALRRLSFSEATASLGSHGVPFSVVRTVDEVCDDDHLRARGAIRESSDGLVVDYPVSAGGQRSHSSDRKPDRAADEADVLAQLGIGPEDVLLLRAQGAFGAVVAS